MLKTQLPLHVLFTDEATFRRDGNINLRNQHNWSVGNPHVKFQWVHKYNFQSMYGQASLVTMWLDYTFYPSAWMEELTDVFLKTHYHSCWRMCQVECREGCGSSMMVLCLIINSRTTRDYLNHVFPGRWIGWSGTVSWWPWSLDITPLHFYLWGHIRSKEHATNIPNWEELWRQMEARAGHVWNNPGLMKHFRQLLLQQAAACIKQGGHNFGHLLLMFSLLINPYPW